MKDCSEPFTRAVMGDLSYLSSHLNTAPYPGQYYHVKPYTSYCVIQVEPVL